MSQTPVKVPASAANYTPATQDQDLRSQINALLIREGHVTKIQEHFLHALNAHPSNWPSTVQSHALALLRAGEVTTFPALVRRVLEDVRHDTAAAAAAAAASASSSSSTTASANTSSSSSSSDNANANSNGASTNGEVNGTSGSSTNGSSSSKNGTGAGGVNGTGAGGGSADGSLAVPQAVVDAVLKVARECLDTVCEVDDGSTAG